MLIEIDLDWRNGLAWPMWLHGADDELGGVSRGFIVSLPFLWLRARWLSW